LHPEVNSIRALDAKSEVEAIRQEKLNKLLFNEIAAASRSSDETIKPSLTSFGVTLNKLTNSTSLLTLDIGKIAEMESQTIEHMLAYSWQPKEGEFSDKAYPIYTYDAFQ